MRSFKPLARSDLTEAWMRTVLSQRHSSQAASLQYLRFASWMLVAPMLAAWCFASGGRCDERALLVEKSRFERAYRRNMLPAGRRPLCTSSIPPLTSVLWLRSYTRK
jgi:hypothetical protein